MLVPNIVHSRVRLKSRYHRARTSDVIDWNPIFLQCSDKPLSNRVLRQHADDAVSLLPTRCDNPLAPPPPRTNPMDLPHNLLAKREKSFVCGALCWRAVGAPRYFLISCCTLSFRFFSAVTATGSCNDCVGRGGGARPLFGCSETQLHESD